MCIKADLWCRTCTLGISPVEIFFFFFFPPNLYFPATKKVRLYGVHACSMDCYFIVHAHDSHFAALHLYPHEEMEAGSLSPLLTEAPAKEGALRRPQTPERLPSKRVYAQNQHREPLPDGPHEWEPGRFAYWRDGPICSADPAQMISTYEERSWAGKRKEKRKLKKNWQANARIGVASKPRLEKRATEKSSQRQSKPSNCLDAWWR